MRRHLFGLIVCCEIIAAAAILLSVAGVVHGVDVWKRIGTSLAVVWMAIAWLVAVTSRTHGPILQLHRWLFETSWEVTLRYVAFLRFQILLLLALVLFPWLARTSLDRLLGNLFLVSLLDVFFISWMAVLVTWSIMVTSRLVCRYGSLRFGGEGIRLQSRIADRARKWRLVLFASFAMPIPLTCLVTSSMWMWGWLPLLAGTAAAWVTLMVITWQRESLMPSSIPPSDLLLNGGAFRRSANDEKQETATALDAITRILGPGYYDPVRRQSLEGHMLALTLLAAVLCTYGMIGFAFRPSGGWNDYFPSLGYLMILFLLASWGLSAAAFLLDRWRVPTLLVLTLSSMVMYSLVQTDHFFATRPLAAVDADDSLTPKEAFLAWKKSEEKPLIVCTISGGGIAAAAWSAQVLTGLEEEFGTAFTQSLAATSSASGGSVGTMFYLDDFDVDQPRTSDRLNTIRNAAASSSLRATAWGFAYPDAWRLAIPPVMEMMPHVDRGWALQETWRFLLTNPSTSMLDWRKRVRVGEIPVPLFDCTAVETGRQFLICPVDTNDGKAFLAHQSFRDLYPTRDIDVVVAARLSATFPWVTPITRIDHADGRPVLHVADGAYVDNYGITTMVEWLEQVLPEYVVSSARRDV
ncbi:MAG TPA: patatin-like phospholipase family protein, partial [Planctomycetaceae bacterium]|nr:patatin-like phospholipase family protein [Planctomycetaceae bacterium]